jgi:hypothetical protein
MLRPEMVSKRRDFGLAHPALVSVLDLYLKTKPVITLTSAVSTAFHPLEYL